MCFPVNCSKCNKISWQGCGNHKQNIKKQHSLDKLCNCGKTNWD
jgi:hypothetical protein